MTLLFGTIQFHQKDVRRNIGVIADFVGADTDQAKFDQGIGKLLQALQVSR